MKKVNKRGFLLAETIGISVVVITALVIIYTQFINVNNSYYRTYNYNNVNKLYLTNQVKQFISNDTASIYNSINEENLYVDITDCSNVIEYMYCENLMSAIDAKKVIVTKNNVKELSNNINNYDFSETMKKYIKSSKSNEDGYRLIIEFNDNTIAGLKMSEDITQQIPVIPNEPQVSYKCIRATVLHTEECTQTDSTYYCSGAGYTASGSKGTTTITYGNLGTEGTLTRGDAFDCDVNGDGTYDATTERFYYVSDLYNTTNQEFDSDYAVLIYYNNTTAGVADNTSSSAIAYESNNENWHGPVKGKTNLPTTTQWSNVSLSNVSRAILTQTGTTSTTGGTLPTAFSYEGYAARLLIYQEVSTACAGENNPRSTGEFDDCNYLFENTQYSNSALGTLGFWLETPLAGHIAHVWYVYGDQRHVSYNSAHVTGGRAIRPVIEVLKTDIDY